MSRLIGYARVSTEDQTIALQVEALQAAGVAETDIYADEGISGASSVRPGLDAMLAAAQVGDTIVIWRLDRLGRSVIHLATLAETLRERGIGLKSLSDGVDTATATGRLVYGLLSTLAEFERETIKERVTAGMASARKRGVNVGRRKALTTAQVMHARQMQAEGKSCADIAAVVGVDRTTVWRALKA